MNRPVHFEIQASDPEKLKKFYEMVFEWKIEKWGPVDYWLIGTGKEGEPGINGAILPRNSAKPKDKDGVNAYVCTIDVANIDETMKKAEAGGARLALEKRPVMGIGWVAYYKDPDGNLFGMMQNDPNAK
ncbi:MAG TPA: VOC family protein [Anaerolineales bacterium]